MISSCMFSSAPSVAKARLTADDDNRGRLVRPTSAPTSRPSAPVASNSARAPPTNRIVRMTSAPAMIPRGTASERPSGSRAQAPPRIRAGDYDLTSGGGVVTALKLPRQDTTLARGDDGAEEQDERMRKLQSHRGGRISQPGDDLVRAQTCARSSRIGCRIIGRGSTRVPRSCSRKHWSARTSRSGGTDEPSRVARPVLRPRWDRATPRASPPFDTHRARV